MSARYGEPRRQAQLELRAAAAQIVVEAELVLRSLDELAGTPARQPVLERHHADVLRRVSAFEAALHHLVNLELLASGAPAGQELASESSKSRSGSPPAEQHARPRLTIPIVGDPDKPKRPRPASPNVDATDEESGPADEPLPDS
jgi:hypothetical protein